jgi:acetolactate synthase-1/2/3 large subunit
VPTFSRSRFASGTKLAEAFGALGLRVERPEDLAPAIQRGLAADRPTLIHVPIAIEGPADR